jgi:hypothetical protein
MNDIELVDLHIDDIELVRNWRNSKEVSSYMYSSSIISEEDQKKWFEKINQDPTCKYWIVTYKGKKVGVASITNISNLFKSCYWAFYLGDTSIRGAGIGAKIEYNVLEYVFEELKLNKLRCEVIVTNEKVIKMHEKFGFRREAYYREHFFKENNPFDVVGLAMLNNEWKQMKEYLKNKVYG